MIKEIRSLSKALLNESRKRIPYIIAVLLILGLFQGYKSYTKIRDNSTTTTHLVKEVQILSTQNKDLALQNQQLLEQLKDSQKQNIRLSEESKAYTRCVGIAFLQYINTGNPVVLKDDDLNACVILQVSKTSSSSTPTTSQPTTPQTNQQPTSGQQSNNQGNSTGSNGGSNFIQKIIKGLKL